jgi:glycosyltransferase involved in cell wall biosynthesis
MNVLVSAYACEPDKGSEPGVGWHWAQQIARFHFVWVMTRKNNQASIETELAKNPNANLNFCYVDLPGWASFWKKAPFGIYLYYLMWQFLAFRQACKLKQRIHFDLGHHVTFGNLWLPSFVPFLRIPFIFGPIGGGETVPKALYKNFSFRWRCYEKIRQLTLISGSVFNPFLRLAIKKAALILVRTEMTGKLIQEKFKKKTVLMLETGVDDEFLEEINRVDTLKVNGRIVMAGRLLHWKGFDLGIQAFAGIFSKFPNASLIIIGTGPEQSRLKKIAAAPDLTDKVYFLGHQPRAKVLENMVKGQIFLYPGMKDAGAWVLFEAMAAGLPVICLDHAGPAEIIDDNCGIKIPIAHHDQVIAQLSHALAKLLASPKINRNMGKAARRRLKDSFHWNSKGDALSEFYHQISDQQQNWGVEEGPSKGLEPRSVGGR